MPKTAEEHQRDIRDAQTRQAKERREFLQKQKELEYYEDLRDDTISIAKNSGLSFAEIHARGGPTVTTLTKWLDKEVSRPWTGKLRSTLRICGHDLGIVELKSATVIPLDRRA